MDLIDRRDATSIPVLPKEHREYQTNYLDDAYELGWYDCQKYIGQLPSAQKTGKWITKSDKNPYYTTWWYECSECGQKPLRDEYWQEVLSDYCPNCGARMEREEE